MCSPAYAKISRRNLQYPAACGGDFLFGDRAFDGNSITNVIIGNGVVYIGPNAFTGDGVYSNDNQITSITLGNSIKYIGNYAFDDHRISTIIIPESVVYIGRGAFAPRNQHSLINITIGKYVMLGTSEGAAFSNNGNFDIIYQNTDKRAGKYTYANGNWNYSP
jgi:hypothetical protein